MTFPGRDLDPDLRTRLERELQDGERLDWLAQPRPWRHALRTLPLVLFGIPWTAFAVFWTAVASGLAGSVNQGAGALFGLFGVPFVLVGLGMLSAPLWARRRALSTVYAITNRRVIVQSGGRTVRTQSYEPSQFGEIVRTERSDGSGDLTFAQQWVSGRRGRQHLVREGFFGVPDVREAEKALRELAGRG